MSRISFAPLEPDAVHFLVTRTGIDYSFCDFASPQWFCCTARDGDRILGVFIGEAVTWFEIQITCAIDHPRFLTRRLLKAIFTSLFSQAVRLTAFVSPDNEQGLNIIRHLNFQYEGFVRLGIEGRRDAMMFGLLRQECRYLSNMRPASPASDFVNRETMDVESGGKFDRGHSRSSDVQNVSHRQLGHLVMFAGLVIGVAQPLSGIFLPTSPAQMAGIDAIANTTTVGGISRPIRVTMRSNTDETMNFPRCASKTHLGIAASIHREWPNKTVIALMGNGIEEGVMRSHSLNIQEV